MLNCSSAPQINGFVRLHGACQHPEPGVSEVESSHSPRFSLETVFCTLGLVSGGPVAFSYSLFLSLLAICSPSRSKALGLFLFFAFCR